ncbi:16S rRNA (cytosine967-C5)-methyltransferase [Gammaproteobacteria bacterium]
MAITLHSLITVAAELLGAVLSAEQGADHTLSRYFQDHPRFGSRDRRILADAVYGCLRRLRSLGYILGQPEHPNWRLTKFEAQTRLAAWILNEGNEKREEINAILGAEINLLPANIAISRPPAVAADLPDWLYDALTLELGTTEVQTLAAALVLPALLDLRVNTLRTNRGEVIRQLQEAGIEATPTPLSPVGLRLPARTSLMESELYRQGLVEIQDEGSQLIGQLLAPRRHEIVVDFCAGAGGKTLHLGALMANTGTLHAFDPVPRRLDQLRSRIERAGITTVRSARIDNLAAPPILALRGKVDRVLVDAPCTGTGTLRRSPDIKWRHHNLTRLTTEQKQILATAATLVRPGGRLVYATCSLLRAENEAIVEDFLASHPDFVLIPPDTSLARLNIPPDLLSKEAQALRLYPHRHATDGFYAALLARHR